LGLFLFLCCMYACKKNNDAHPSSGNSGTGTGTLSFSTPVDSAQELIVSETGGKVLVDTVFTNNGTFSTTLHTNDTLVDVTIDVVSRGAGPTTGPAYYFVTTYKAVNPARWQTVNTGNYLVPLGPVPPSVSGTLTYLHVPNISDPFADFSAAIQFSDYAQPTTATEIYGGSTLQFQYYQYGNNLDYLLFPGIERYKLHTHVTNNDIIDLTEMDTAIAVKFSRPAEYATVTTCTLIGYSDTTNYSNSLLLYLQFLPPPINPAADVEYPKEKFKAYELNINFSNSNNDDAFYYSYGDTVPSALALPNESSFNLSSSTASLFTVNFAAPKPSYYLTQWQTGNVYWAYYAPPDSTTLRPLSTLTALNSKLLQGQNLSSLGLTNFGFGTAQGLDYLHYFDYLTDPALLKVRRLPSRIGFSKSF
jgi:hypothetical protein